jgi:hypothetical protein
MRLDCRLMTLGFLVVILSLIGCGDSGARPASRNPSPDSAAPSSQAQPVSSEWQLSSKGTAGPLTIGSSEADLRQRYGAAAVDSTRIQIGEGETMAGTVLYPRDSLQRVEVIWQDSVGRQRPSRVILRGNRSRWQVGPGISLGTSLGELERLNGRPFTLAGFGWDYAGVVTDWKGGALDSALAGVKLYLDPGPEQYESPAYSQVLGDRDYSSSLPPMQQLSPKVTQIFVEFE